MTISTFINCQINPSPLKTHAPEASSASVNLCRHVAFQVPQEVDKFISWMKSKLTDLPALEKRVEKLEAIYSHKKHACKEIKKELKELQQHFQEEGGFGKFLLGLKLKKQLKLQQCSKDALLLVEHPFKHRRSELIKVFNELSKMNKSGSCIQLEKSARKISEELDKLEGYAKLASELKPRKENYQASIKQKANHFCREILPGTFRSALPIATGLLTFHQLSAVFENAGNTASLLVPVAGAGVAAAVSASIVAWSQLKSGSLYSQEFKQATRGIVRTLAIGAGVQAVLLIQQFAEKSGFNFQNSWNKLLVFAMLGGLLDAVIGYCVDVSQLVGDKLEKYYSNRLSQRDKSLSPVQNYALEEVERLKLICNDLLKPESRRELKDFLKDEGIRPGKLAKSIIFDVSVGIFFSLIGAHLQAMRAQSKSLIRSGAAHGSTKLLSWSEKMLTRGVRTSLTKPKVMAAPVSQIEDTVKELIEAVVE